MPFPAAPAAGWADSAPSPAPQLGPSGDWLRSIVSGVPWSGSGLRVGQPCLEGEASEARRPKRDRQGLLVAAAEIARRGVDDHPARIACCMQMAGPELGERPALGPRDLDDAVAQGRDRQLTDDCGTSSTGGQPEPSSSPNLSSSPRHPASHSAAVSSPSSSAICSMNRSRVPPPSGTSSTGDPAFRQPQRLGLDPAGAHLHDLCRPDQPAGLQHPQMLHHGGQRHRQQPAQLADPRGPAAQPFHHRLQPRCTGPQAPGTRGRARRNGYKHSLYYYVTPHTPRRSGYQGLPIPNCGHRSQRISGILHKESVQRTSRP